MPTSVFLARLIGPIFVIAGVAVLINREAYRQAALEFIESPALLYLAGIIGLAGGLALVLAHNVWIASWRVVITLIGWIALIRGAIIVLAPDQTAAFTRKFLRNDNLMLINSGVALLLGGILCIFGYIV